MRQSFPNSTLADLYDPDAMPRELVTAHATLDRAVDQLYRKQRFESDRERVEHLFLLYERMTAGLLAAAAPARRNRSKTARRG